MDIRDYADKVWRGAVEDSIAHAGMGGSGVIEIADGLRWQPGFGNVIAFRSAGELILFDTGNVVFADGLHARIREWTTNPLTTAFYSHGHIDHVMGLAPFDAEGGVRPQVVAHELIRDRFDRYALTAGYNSVINQRQFQLPELRWPTEYRHPDVTYRDAMTVSRGELTFGLFHAKGETDDATVAYVPVGGEHSVGTRLAEALRPIAPHLSAAVIQGSGHFVPDERPDDFAQQLIAFLT